MREIPLSGRRGDGHVTLVDDDIYERVGQDRWHLSDTGYAVRRNRGVTTRLHRVVVECPRDKVVDHLNGNRLDNRRSNLRICTPTENAKNRSYAKGYCWDASKRKWMVRYKNKFYGRYATELEARRAFRLARSGVPYQKEGRKYMYLPDHISKQFGKYTVRIQRNGKRHFFGYYKNIKDAQAALHKAKERIGISVEQ